MEYSAFCEEREAELTKEAKATRTQWHPAFCAAVRLELIENKADLDYTNEYNLNSKPKDAERIVIQSEKLKQKDEKLYADSVVRVAVEENKDVFRISRVKRCLNH